MKKEELMKMLRNPAQYHKEKEKKKTVEQESSVQQQKNLSPEQKKENALLLGVGVGVVILVFATLLISLSAKNRAENLTAALDPKQLEGLTVADKEFNPSAGVTYVHIQEGQDRNVSVSNLGSTLPIISRFNYKTFTPKNFEIIGAAPWALTTNFSSNIADPELMRYLLGNDKMIQSFINRPDVAPLLEDPQLLLALAAAVRTLYKNDYAEKIAFLKNQRNQVGETPLMMHVGYGRTETFNLFYDGSDLEKAIKKMQSVNKGGLFSPVAAILQSEVVRLSQDNSGRSFCQAARAGMSYYPHLQEVVSFCKVNVPFL